MSGEHNDYRDAAHEIDNRLGIELRARGGNPGERNPGLDHILAEYVASLSLQLSAMLADMSSVPCNCGEPCPTVQRVRQVLMGVMLPSIAMAAGRTTEQATFADLMEAAEEVVDWLLVHARAAVGKPL